MFLLSARPPASSIGICPEYFFQTSNSTAINSIEIKIEYEESSTGTEDPLAPMCSSVISKHYGNDSISADNQICSRNNYEPLMERSNSKDSTSSTINDILEKTDTNLIAPSMDLKSQVIRFYQDKFGPLTECSFTKSRNGRPALINNGFKYSRGSVSNLRTSWKCSRSSSSKCKKKIVENNGLFYATVGEHNEGCQRLQGFANVSNSNI